MNREVMIKALNVIKDSVINTDFPLTNKLADAIYAIDFELLKALKPVAYMDSKGVLFNNTTHPQLNTALYALDEVKHD